MQTTQWKYNAKVFLIYIIGVFVNVLIVKYDVANDSKDYYDFKNHDGLSKEFLYTLSAVSWVAVPTSCIVLLDEKFR